MSVFYKYSTPFGVVKSVVFPSVGFIPILGIIQI
jgi:hypothetical protein